MKSKAFNSANAFRSLAAMALLAGGFASISSTAQAQQTVFQGVRIDMSGLPTGAVETRQQLQACLQRALPQAFAGRINPSARSAPVLVVRPTSVWLTSAGVASSSTRFGFENPMTGLDSLEGYAVFGNARVPVMATASPDRGAAAVLGYTAARRTENLCNSFAYWVSRRV
jgi:hypothetical protein